MKEGFVILKQVELSLRPLQILSEYIYATHSSVRFFFLNFRFVNLINQINIYLSVKGFFITLNFLK
jgi:hypothetical protein